jgi:hypothetical protein
MVVSAISLRDTVMCTNRFVHLKDRSYFGNSAAKERQKKLK